MFNFIIATNKDTKEVDDTINNLLKTKTMNDKIIVVNYHQNSIKYRSWEGIDYRHIKESRQKAISISLPKDSNVVLLDNDITIMKTFVKDLYKHYDFHNFYTLRVDNVTPNGKFVEADIRIGSKITTKSFKYFALAFNTTLLNKIGETPEETAIMADKWGVPLDILPNVKVLKTTKTQRKAGVIGLTIFVPSLKYKYAPLLRDLIRPNDKLFEFDATGRSLIRFVNQKVAESPNNCIVLMNPESKIKTSDILNRIRGLFKNNKCFIIDTEEYLTTDAWVVFSKEKYVFTHKIFDDVISLQKNILSYNNDYTTYIEEHPKNIKSSIQDERVLGDMISIIIPFMYNGDRWHLFKASVEKLYQQTRDYDNIEIIVHETAPTRYIKKSFIDEYELVYLFSEYHGLFHRAWNLNVAAKYLAKGATLVFFDGDLLVNKEWVNELINCDKTIPYIGWGKMKNISKRGTDTYLKTKNITNDIERTRKPNGHAAAAGINIIPRDMFFAIGGWPEAYKDLGYGGEDNSLSFKMIALGMYSNDMKKW